MSEESALELFDSAKAAQLLRSKVRAAFIELIPEDKWVSMIEQEANVFFLPKTRVDSWGRKEYTTSEFGEVAREELRKLFNEDEDFRNMLQEKMVTVLTGELDTRLPDTIKTLAKEAFDTMVGHLQHDMEQRIRNMLQHGL